MEEVYRLEYFYLCAVMEKVSYAYLMLPFDAGVDSKLWLYEQGFVAHSDRAIGPVWMDKLE